MIACFCLIAVCTDVTIKFVNLNDLEIDCTENAGHFYEEQI